jgi:hypothetical protein
MQERQLAPFPSHVAHGDVHKENTHVLLIKAAPV